MSAKANTTATTASMHPAASRLHSRRVVISTEGMDPKIARRKRRRLRKRWQYELNSMDIEELRDYIHETEY